MLASPFNRVSRLPSQAALAIHLVTNRCAVQVWEVLQSGRMPSMPARLPSAGLRPHSGTSPSSPTAMPYSPTKPGTGAGGAATMGPAARLGTVRGSSGSASLVGSSAASLAPPGGLTHASSGGMAALAGALPTSDRQPAALPSSVAAPGGRARCGGATAAARKGSRPGSAAVPGPGPAGSLAGLDPELQQRLEGAAAQLASPEWKARLEGLEAVQAAVGSQAGALPAGAQLWLADALKDRVTDANLKCQQQVRLALDGRGPQCQAALSMLPAAGVLLALLLSWVLVSPEGHTLANCVLIPLPDAGSCSAERRAGLLWARPLARGARPPASHLQVPRLWQPLCAAGGLLLLGLL